MNESELKQFRNDFIDLLNKYNIGCVQVIEKGVPSESEILERLHTNDYIVFTTKDGKQQIRFPSCIYVDYFKKINGGSK